MSTQHTPGPWAVGSKSGHIETANAWRMSIAICYNKDSKADGVSKEEFEANARLIAAAPELLKALNECRRAIQGGTTFKPYDSRGAGFQQEFGIAFVEYLNATIAKATGETK